MQARWCRDASTQVVGMNLSRLHVDSAQWAQGPCHTAGGAASRDNRRERKNRKADNGQTTECK